MINEKEYIAFMYNPDNICKCDNCPENRGFSSWGGNMPCGQQNCWVQVHCDMFEVDYDEDEDCEDDDYMYFDNAADEVYRLVKDTMVDAEHAYFVAMNESEYNRLESVAKETILYAMKHGGLSDFLAKDIAERCMVVL